MPRNLSYCAFFVVDGSVKLSENDSHYCCRLSFYVSEYHRHRRWGYMPQKIQEHIFLGQLLCNSKIQVFGGEYVIFRNFVNFSGTYIKFRHFVNFVIFSYLYF